MGESGTAGSPAYGGERPHARIEEAIARLEGVAAARIVGGPGNRLDALEVTTNPDWPVETVRRDVQAVLQQRFEMEVPARFVLVRAADPPRRATPSAQATPSLTSAPEPEPEPGPSPAQTAAASGSSQPPRGRETAQAPPVSADDEGHGACDRLVLDTVHLALRAQGTSVGVDLLDGEERLRGTAGPVGPDGVLAGVVNATAHALRARMQHDLSTVVAEIVAAGGDQIAIATLHASDGRSRQRVTGSALVRGSAEDAMARATLDATNRLFGSAIRRRGHPSFERSVG